MIAELSYHDALAALDFQIAMGADEAIGDAPLDRYALSAAVLEQRTAAQASTHAAANAPNSRQNAGLKPTLKSFLLPEGAQPPAPQPKVDPVAVARSVASAAGSLEALKGALAAFEHCDIKRGARSQVFSDGHPEARVMIIGEAPGRDEDIAGRPFVGAAGQLLDRMLAAIELSRSAEDTASAVYITNILPWRPPQNRDPNPDEIAMLVPFVERHIELIAPDVLVLMGNISCQAMLGRRGITRLRGTWTEVFDRPALPMFHPAFLLRTPAAKREAWADLLALKARLKAAKAP